MRKRFIIRECLSGYELQDTFTLNTGWLGDGVYTLFTATGKAMRPGSEYFRRTWERHINATANESLKAYFPQE